MRRLVKLSLTGLTVGIVIGVSVLSWRWLNMIPKTGKSLSYPDVNDYDYANGIILDRKPSVSFMRSLRFLLDETANAGYESMIAVRRELMHSDASEALLWSDARDIIAFAHVSLTIDRSIVFDRGVADLDDLFRS